MGGSVTARKTREVPAWVRVVTIGSVSVVAAVAAVVSYVHMYELALRAHEEWRAVLVPLSADGLLVAASMVLFVRRRDGERPGVLPWVGMVLGLAASLGANVVAGMPAVLDWVEANPWAVTGWPPVSLAISFELLISVLRRPRRALASVGRHAEDAAETARETTSAGAEVVLPDAEERTPEPLEVVQRRSLPAGANRTTRTPRETRSVKTEPDPLLGELVEWARQAGSAPSRNAVMKRFSVGSKRANRLLDQLDRTPIAEAS